MELLPSQATTRKALVHRERETAQTLLGPRARTGLGEKPASTAFLNKHALESSLVSQGDFHFRKCSSEKLVLCHFWEGP